MALVTRILLIFAIIGGIASFVGGWRVIGTRNQLQKDLEERTVEVAKLNGDVKMQKDAVEVKKGEIKAAEQKIATANAETESIKKDLENQKSQARETQEKLSKVSRDLDEKKVEIEKFTKDFEGMNADQIKAKLKEFADEKASLEQEKKIITEQITKQSANIKDLEEKIKRLQNKTVVTGLTGHILAINTEWNFVVLDIGANQGVVEEATAIVYRDGNLIGKVKITSVEPSISIGDILPEWKKADVQEGDSVVF